MLVAMLLLVFMHLAPSFGRKIAQLSYMQTLVCILLTIDATDGPGTKSRKERVKILHIECKEGEKQSGEAARTFGSALERAMPRTKTDVEVLKSHRINISSSFKGECALLVAAATVRLIGLAVLVGSWELFLVAISTFLWAWRCGWLDPTEVTLLPEQHNDGDDSLTTYIDVLEALETCECSKHGRCNGCDGECEIQRREVLVATVLKTGNVCFNPARA
jgi:hypothetical protein